MRWSSFGEKFYASNATFAKFNGMRNGVGLQTNGSYFKKVKRALSSSTLNLSSFPFFFSQFHRTSNPILNHSYVLVRPSYLNYSMMIQRMS